MSESTIQLSPYIDVVPSIHQRSPFAAEVRRLFLAKRYKAVAVEMPPFLMQAVIEGVERLPLISAAVYNYVTPLGDTAHAYVPIDPCDSIIEAIRLAIPERVSIVAADMNTPNFENRTTLLPDEYALRRCSLADYYNTVSPFLPPTPAGSLDDEREKWMGVILRQLSERKIQTLFVCGIGHLKGIQHYFENPEGLEELEPEFLEPKLYSVRHDTLYFMLGELPYLTYLYERARRSIDLKAYEETDGVKELLVAARDEYRRDDPLKGETLAPQRLQTMLTYMRNLSLIKRRMTPDLYEILVAAKGVAGSLFAAKVVELAKYYPFLDTEPDLPVLDMGMDRGRSDDLGSVEMGNRFQHPPMEWKTFKLKRPPPPRLRQKWAYMWNPFRSCSWPPEDNKIESFHRHVRSMTQKLLTEDQARVEKFTTSVKDGIDLRETIRNWHKGEIYVKEVPATRGNVEAVVFIFDEEDAWERYPWRVTWYAEHAQESTLSLYATNYLEEMVGPGVARARYGGCFMLYPPRPIPDIWQDPRLDFCRTPAERLTVGALLHSNERFVTYVAHRRPGLRLRETARRLNRHLIFIPLSSFSRDTVQRLRILHVLNGQRVRSWASHFIRDPWQL